MNGAYGDLLDPERDGQRWRRELLLHGGSGGGLVRIAGSVVMLDGSILADGGSGTYYGGGGSGGGVRIDADTLAAAGTFMPVAGRARSYRYGGAGGGGRIAIYYQTMSLPAGNIVANGGKSGDGATSRNGGAGTIYLKSYDGTSRRTDHRQ